MILQKKLLFRQKSKLQTQYKMIFNGQSWFDIPSGVLERENINDIKIKCSWNGLVQNVNDAYGKYAVIIGSGYTTDYADTTVIRYVPAAVSGTTNRLQIVCLGVIDADIKIDNDIHFIEIKNGTEYYIDGIKIGNSSAEFKLDNYSLGCMRRKNEPGRYARFFGELYSCNLSYNNLLYDLNPVPKDNIDFSIIPAPSNCLYNKVSQGYFINLGTLEPSVTV